MAAELPRNLSKNLSSNPRLPCAVWREDFEDECRRLCHKKSSHKSVVSGKKSRIIESRREQQTYWFASTEMGEGFVDGSLVLENSIKRNDCGPFRVSKLFQNVVKTMTG